MAQTPVSIGPPSQSREPIRVTLDWGRTYNLWMYDVGLACCAVEFVAATMRTPELDAAGVSTYPDGPERAEVMVVSGTVTDKLAPAILRLYQRMPEPRYVISFGSCANCGGPYWDSYCVTKGVDQIIPVDVYVPGCPPRPEALFDGLAELHRKVSAGARP